MYNIKDRSFHLLQILWEIFLSLINTYRHKMEKLVENIFFIFELENRICGYFHYYIRNQHVKIRKYREFDGNRKVHLFGTEPLMGFGSFFLNLIFLKKY